MIVEQLVAGRLQGDPILNRSLRAVRDRARRDRDLLAAQYPTNFHRWGEEEGLGPAAIRNNLLTWKILAAHKLRPLSEEQETCRRPRCPPVTLGGHRQRDRML